MSSQRLHSSNTGRIYMDLSTVEHGKECPVCLRWFVPIRPEDECVHCLQHGCPEFPNRLRYVALTKGVTLREISRKSRLCWRTVRLISQGKVSPHRNTEHRILRALDVPIRKKEIAYIFPHSRHV